MDRDPASILDIVFACRRVRRFVAARSREELEADEQLQYAVLHAILLIGEAASRLSPEFRQTASSIPWGEIIGTRNRIIHGYDRVKLDVIWDIATNKVQLSPRTTGTACAPATGLKPLMARKKSPAETNVESIRHNDKRTARASSCAGVLRGHDEPYQKLKRTLRAEIDEEAWSSLYSTKSRPFPKPASKKDRDESDQSLWDPQFAGAPMGFVWNVMLSFDNDELWEDERDEPRESCEPLERINAWIPHGRLVSLIGPTYGDGVGYGIDANLYGGGFKHFDIDGFIEVVRARNWKARAKVQLWIKGAEEGMGTEPFTLVKLAAHSAAGIKAAATCTRRAAGIKAAETRKRRAAGVNAAATRKRRAADIKGAAPRRNGAGRLGQARRNQKPVSGPSKLIGHALQPGRTSAERSTSSLFGLSAQWFAMWVERRRVLAFGLKRGSRKQNRWPPTMASETVSSSKTLISTRTA